MALVRHRCRRADDHGRHVGPVRPQAANWDVVGGVSFKKGCYPGQEIVARMQYLGRLKERLYAFRAETDDMAERSRVFSATFGDGQSVRHGRERRPAIRPAAACCSQSCDSVLLRREDLRLGSRHGPRLRSLSLPYALPDAAPAPRTPRMSVASGRTMCLAVIALDAHPRYALVVAANRDEFHARAAERAHWWRDQTGHALLAGRDVPQGGTWLGVNRRALGLRHQRREPGTNTAGTVTRCARAARAA